MKDKVTILTGAGFTVPPDFGGPSTKLLTDKLRKLKITHFDINGKTPGEYFYRKLCYHYTRKIKTDCDLSIVNFETIIHFLEALYSHLTSYNKPDIKGKDASILKKIAKSKGVKPSFLILKDAIKKDLSALKSTTKIEFLNQIVKNIYSHFIDAIIDELRKFNSDSKNIGMRKFENMFLDKHLPESKFTRRFYTLNYDTWLNKYLGIYDGFDSSGKFEDEKVMKQYNMDCHYNLHGSILWQNDLNKNKMKKLKNPVDYLGYAQSSTFGLNREPLIATPIITGYHKLERMKFNPYLQFYYSLQNDIINSAQLILIGYSFSDTHINNILSLFKGECIIVSYIKNWIDAEEAERKVTPKGNPIDYENVLFDRWDDDVTSILQSIEPIDGGFDNIKEKDIQNGWIISRNGNTKVWWKGIGNDFYNEWTNIIA
ncbi:MAG: SIR2 family protein [Chitinophagales bacterium]